jgi:DNA-binding MarR family transcriptional regulator
MVSQTARPVVHEAIFQLGRLSELFQKRRAQLAASVGLTEHQWGVLEEVSTEHFMPSMFARQRESSAAAVSKTIRQLVDRGLVTVSLQVNDARQRKYELTAAGKETISRLRSHRQRAISEVWEHLPERDLELFASFGRALADRLEQLAASSEGELESGPHAGAQESNDVGDGETAISAE